MGDWRSPTYCSDEINQINEKKETEHLLGESEKNCHDETKPDGGEFVVETQIGRTSKITITKNKTKTNGKNEKCAKKSHLP